jgi:hypothetical protein
LRSFDVPTAEAIDRYLNVVPGTKRGTPSVAPRKVLAMGAGGLTMIRSSDPKGYLIPDVGSFVWSSGLEGTLRPDTTTIVIADDGIVIRISAPDEFADHVFPALLSGRLGSVLMTHPSSDHITGLGIAGLLGSYGALTGAVGIGEPADSAARASSMIVDLLEDAPAFAGVEAGTRSGRADVAIPVMPRPAADASVAEIASRIAAISGLTDGELARVFRVARETFQRWRTGELTKPNVGNRRRLGLLLRLLDDLVDREVRVDQWLRNVSAIDRLTPYELLERGRLDDVEYLAAQVPGGALEEALADDGLPVTRAHGYPGFARRVDEPAVDVTADDEGWEEVEAEAIDDDD